MITVRNTEDLAKIDYTPFVISVNIDGIVYTSTKLSVTQGLKLVPKLVDCLGASLLALAMGDLSTNKLASAAQQLQVRAAAVDLVDLATSLLQNVKASHRGMGPNRAQDPGPILEKWEEHFAGEYPHLIRVCLFAARHIYLGPTLGSLSKSGPQNPQTT